MACFVRFTDKTGICVYCRFKYCWLCLEAIMTLLFYENCFFSLKETEINIYKKSSVSSTPSLGAFFIINLSSMASLVSEKSETKILIMIQRRKRRTKECV